MRRTSMIATFSLAAAFFACGEASTSPNAGTGPPDGSPIGSGSAVHQGIEYEVVLQVMESFPVQIAADVEVTNPGDSTVRTTFPDGCVALLRVYDPAADGPVWDQGHEVGCTMALVPLELAPEESTSFRAPTASARDVLGDDLPDGTYEFVVYLRPDGETVEIEAGPVELAIPR